MSDSPTQNSSGSGERSESPASAALAYYKGWAVEGLDDLAKLGSTRKKKSSSPHRHGHRKSATSPLAGGATTICSTSPTSPLAPTGFSPGSSPSFGRPDSPKMPPMGAAGGATVISTLSGSVLSGLNSSSLSARTPDDEDDSASIASGGSYAPSLAMSTASRGSIGSSYSRISASVPGQRKSPRGLQRQDSGACNSLAAQHRRRQRELNSPSEVGGARRRGSIRRGAPALTEATQEEEKAAANSSQNVDHLLNNVMRAYANLELSGVDDKQLGSLAQALGKNAALKSINLSHNKQIEKSGIVALAGGLAANSSVTSLNSRDAQTSLMTQRRSLYGSYQRLSTSWRMGGSGHDRHAPLQPSYSPHARVWVIASPRASRRLWSYLVRMRVAMAIYCTLTQRIKCSR